MVLGNFDNIELQLFNEDAIIVLEKNLKKEWGGDRRIMGVELSTGRVWILKRFDPIVIDKILKEIILPFGSLEEQIIQVFRQHGHREIDGQDNAKIKTLKSYLMEKIQEYGDLIEILNTYGNWTNFIIQGMIDLLPSENEKLKS